MESPRPSRVALAAVGGLLLAALATAACRSAPVKPEDGRLPPCPSSPNCVNSQAGDVAPLPFEGSADDALARLRALVAGFPRTEVVEEGPGYLHATFRSAVFRFVDDVQFVVDEEAGVVHVRSASRLGWSDLGANRRRVEKLRAAW